MCTSWWARLFRKSFVAGLVALGGCAAAGGVSTSGPGQSGQDEGEVGIAVDPANLGGGTPVGAGSGGANGLNGDSPAECGPLTARVRDFSSSHEDFETFQGTDVFPGLVEPLLGSDHKPVYAHGDGTAQTSGKANFDQWYRDVPGTNQGFDIQISLTQIGPGLFAYDNDAFFPLDGRGIGNEGNPHNYHFTTEVHTSFAYRGGEVFTFTGDDDLWLFVNDRLALDLGGLHEPRSGTVDFDAEAARLGIEVGESYSMDIFHAERHTVESNFRIETSIDCFVPVIVQ